MQPELHIPSKRSINGERANWILSSLHRNEDHSLNAPRILSCQTAKLLWPSSLTRTTKLWMWQTWLSKDLSSEDLANEIFMLDGLVAEAAVALILRLHLVVEDRLRRLNRAVYSLGLNNGKLRANSPDITTRRMSTVMPNGYTDNLS